MTDPCGQSRTPAHFGDPRKTARQPQDLCRSRRGQTVFLTVLCIAKKETTTPRTTVATEEKSNKNMRAERRGIDKSGAFSHCLYMARQPMYCVCQKKRLVAGQVEDHMNGLAIRDAIGTDVAVVVERGAGTL